MTEGSTENPPATITRDDILGALGEFFEKVEDPPKNDPLKNDPPKNDPPKEQGPGKNSVVEALTEFFDGLKPESEHPRQTASGDDDFDRKHSEYHKRETHDKEHEELRKPRDQGPGTTDKPPEKSVGWLARKMGFGVPRG